VSALPAGSLMSIGEVLNALRPDFPDVTLSKIRFLESEGLVEPARTPSGYRKFSHADLARLRYVLAAQRDHYLPLRVIREHLDAIDRGLTPPGPGERPRAVTAVADTVDAQAFRPGPVDLRLTRDELAREAALAPELLEQVEQYGLVRPLPGSRPGPEVRYDADALAVARAVAQLADYGLEPRHLRGFRTAADREADLIDQVAGPLLRGRSPQARSRAEEVARELGALALQLHTALVRARVRDVIGR